MAGAVAHATRRAAERRELVSGVSAFLSFVNAGVGHLGTTELATFNVVLQINTRSFTPAFGIASAGAILVRVGTTMHMLSVGWQLFDAKRSR